MSMLKTLAAVAVVGVLATPAWAQDDRPPTPQERAAIERVLRAEGFVRWDEIELDHGVWEVEDARTADGRDYDLKLRPRSLEIIQHDADT